MKKITAILLSVLLLITMLSACDTDSGSDDKDKDSDSKSVITVSDITGSNATLTKSDKSEQAAKKGAEISADCRLTTGAETCVYLKIDADSIIKMNEKSEISVSEISSDTLKLDLVKGSVLINEKGQKGRLQMTAGNTLLIVRGTFFTANYDSNNVVVDLIEGEIDVKTDSGNVTNVDQGKRVTVNGDSDAVLETMDVSNFDAFTMDSVMEYKDVLTDGSLSEDDFSYISDFVSDSGKSETGDGGDSKTDDGYTPDTGDGGNSDAGNSGDSETGDGGNSDAGDDIVYDF